MRSLLAAGACWLLMLSGACDRTQESENEPPAAVDWETSTPEAQGIDSAQLAEVLQKIRDEQLGTHSIFFARNGTAVLDVDIYPFTLGDGLHDLASVTKSLTATLIGIAIDKGYISDVKQRVLDFFPDRTIERRDANKESMNIEDLLTMRSGLACGHHDEQELWDMMFQTEKAWVQYILDMPMEGAPGVQYAYCSPNTHLLSAIITAATGMSELDFAREHLFGPMGIRDVRWPSDPQGMSRGWGDAQLRPRDLAKIGLLYLQDGLWNGKRLLSGAWIKQSVRPYTSSGEDERYGYSWRLPESIPGLYFATGRGGQKLYIFPEESAVLVLSSGRDDVDKFNLALASAIESDEPLPENPGALNAVRLAAEALAAIPPAQEVPDLPPLAATIQGKTYDIKEDNYYGLKCMKLTFDGPELTMEACFLDRMTGDETRGDIPIGLDGVYRIFPDFLNGIPGGAIGHWESADTFVSELIAIQGYFSLKLAMTFADDEVHIHMQEATGLLDETVSGRAQ